MEAFFANHGYLMLFLVSFLAATLLPLGSEWLLAAMLLQDFAPLPVIAVATLGNTLGACTTYLIGLYGGPFLIRKLLRINEPAQQRAERFFQKYGVWALLFSWLPVVGDPLCLAGGLFRVPFSRFSLLVFIGKLGRYATLAVFVLGGMQVISG
ncbi:MAG: hypothetical protein A2521_11645 [Deltaproteobacteria bacterium RIFOXYD12_FULL_57_12]|nr:MAG: hypothetical protein A2521_11645 [Deltaproteobacteria bacterium RIFOXYD12_FULL_57_12]